MTMARDFYLWDEPNPMELGGQPQQRPQPMAPQQPMQQPQQQAQPSFMDQLQARFANPMTQQGLGLFLAASQGKDLNEGLNSGMQRAQSWASQMQQQAEAKRKAAAQAAIQNFLKNGQGMQGIPPALQEIARATGDVGPIAQFITKQADPNAGLTDDIKEWKFADKQAADAGAPRPTFQQFMVGKRGGTKHGLVPIPYMKNDGTMGYMVPNTEGEAKELTVPGGGTVMPPATTFQTPTEVITRDKFGRVIARESRNVGEGKAQEVQGEAMGKARVALPQHEADTKTTLELVDKIISHEGTKGNFGVEGKVMNMPGGKAADAWAMIEQVKSKAFLDGFQRMRGGGAVTEVEGLKAETALLRAQAAQSYEAFIDAMKEFRYQVQTGRELARRAAGVGGPNGNAGFDGGSSGGWSARKIN